MTPRFDPLPTATGLQIVGPDIFRWEAFSPAHRVGLTSHAVRNPDGLVVFDPIPLPAASLNELVGTSQPVVVLTNGNHSRAAGQWHERFGSAIHAPADVALEFGVEDRAIRRGAPGVRFPAGWEIIPLPGGAPGETAFFLPARSLMVFGDAVIHLPGRPLELLPDKYCEDPNRLRAGLKSLLTREFTTALFAHGAPLLTDASARLRALL